MAEWMMHPFVINWLSGVSSGVAGCLVGHPLDTIKVRLQTQPTASPMYQGMLDCMRKTWAHEGMHGLYRGVGSPLLGQMVFRAWQFAAYGEAKMVVAGTRDAGKMTIPQFYIAGSLTGFAIAPLEVMIDLFKSQMQVQRVKEATIPGYRNPYRSVFDCMAQIYRSHGVRGCYQGFSATLIRNGQSASWYLGTYEVCRRYLANGGDVAALPKHHTLLAGAVGGFMYWFPTYPTDVIKTAMQTDHPDRSQRKYSGWVDCARQLYRDGGWRRFYRGYTPCLARSMVANAAMFLAYQESESLLKQYVRY